MKFKIGDRVKLNRKLSKLLVSENEIGTIIFEQHTQFNVHWYGVEYDDYIDGHDCDGAGKYGHCLWLKEDDLMLVNPSCVMKIKEWIKSKNKTVINADLFYLIENNFYEFLVDADKDLWSGFVTEAKQFKYKLQATLFLERCKHKLSHKNLKITEHMFISPIVDNYFLLKDED